jgi:hypothetical protein
MTTGRQLPVFLNERSTSSFWHSVFDLNGLLKCRILDCFASLHPRAKFMFELGLHGPTSAASWRPRAERGGTQATERIEELRRHTKGWIAAPSSTARKAQ